MPQIRFFGHAGYSSGLRASLAVIERPEHQHARMHFNGDVSISSKSGSVSVTADEGIQFATREDFSLASREINLLAKNGQISIDQLAVSGDRATSRFKTLRTFADSIETIAQRLTQKLQHSFRLIDGMDQTRAGEALTTVKNLFSLRSRQSAILAKKDIKIDADRIHMG